MSNWLTGYPYSSFTHQLDAVSDTQQPLPEASCLLSIFHARLVTGLASWEAEATSLARGLYVRPSSRDDTRLQNCASSCKSMPPAVLSYSKARDDQPSNTLSHSKRADTGTRSSHAPVLNRTESTFVEKPFTVDGCLTVQSGPAGQQASRPAEESYAPLSDFRECTSTGSCNSCCYSRDHIHALAKILQMRFWGCGIMPSSRKARFCQAEMWLSASTRLLV